MVGNINYNTKPNGTFNTAFGFEAFKFNTTGKYNTANGYKWIYA